MRYLSIVLCIFFIFSFSCSSVEHIKGKTKVETYYLRGIAALEKGLYKKSVEYLTKVKNKFPYSRYAIDAELKLADANFKQDNFLEAQKQYSMFAELHPSNKNVPYAIYKSGVCFFSLLPSTIDRDLQESYRAIKEFKYLIKKYPNSEYAKLAEKKLKESKIKLAKKELYVARYYRKQDKYKSVVNRYKAILKDYPNTGYEEESYFGLTEAYYKLGNLAEAKYYADLLILSYPNSKYVNYAKKIQNKEE
jgi:outer membrane protein assembly factor BamD